MAAKSNLIVVGNGMVGHTLIESLVAGGAHLQWNIMVFCEEPRLAYNRMALSEFFKGKTAEDLSLVKGNFYEEYGIITCVGESATLIDPTGKTVTTSKGQVHPYDKLVLATGSYPFVPPVPGAQGAGCFVYRTIEDLEAIQNFAKGCRRGVVVGGGLLGLEAAQALLNMNLETHCVEFAPRLMALQLDDAAGKTLLKHVNSMGVKVHLSKNTTSIQRTDAGKLSKMVFADGEELEADMIVFSAGIRPRDQIARESGIAVGPRGGVEINDFCQTNFADVYAVGEVALHRGRIYGLVAPGNDMARVCAAHILGREVDPFVGADMSTKLKVVGCEVAVIGDSVGVTPGCEAFVYGQSSKGVYKKLLTNATLDKVIGGIFVGDAAEYNSVLSIMLNDLPVPKDPEALILPKTAGAAGKMGGAELLPDTAKICSCHNVSKGQICSAIRDGALDVEALKACTKAGTGCGGCIPMLQELLVHEKSKMGIVVENHLCEHFKLSRQQLCHIIMVKRLRDFPTVLAEHGQGHGCEICKPAVASILAHTWGDYIHRLDLAVLQDTNDAFLANMQRDGTYSVVPRTPGGEIQPRQLEVLGQIGQRYGLYTKITGGQRIDFFGAQVHQLPDIWEDLNKEGFESGHAYAKALRTVKSCVGSTWCRYGVQDSVGMAIHLENRYKGIRMPHKFKMGVSGCVRECAEAQGKDLGLIAVKGGYNMYICGNGGMKPKHAELLATDLDPEMVVRVADRFIMLYCRTADRLQRTARWLEGLEGGMDYLKSVLLQDSLGMCKELEAQMKELVDKYQDEWATTVKTPIQVQRYKTFINQPADKQNDPNLHYQLERGQIRLPVQEPANPYPLPEPRAIITVKQNGEGTTWETVCRLEQIPVDSGACALVDGVQIAVFRVTGDAVYALHNYDPFSEAHVLSRGLVGDKGGVLKVASPLYKHNFALETGICLAKPDISVPTYPVRVVDGVIQVQSTPRGLPLSAA